jgi:hypothetical protein
MIEKIRRGDRIDPGRPEPTLEDMADKLDEIVDAVNELFEARESRRRSEAFDLLIRMVNIREQTGQDLPLALAHTSHDGEQIIAYLVDTGMIDLAESKIVVTDAGREQVRLALDAAVDGA